MGRLVGFIPVYRILREVKQCATGLRYNRLIFNTNLELMSLRESCLEENRRMKEYYEQIVECCMSRCYTFDDLVDKKKLRLHNKVMDI